MACRGGVLVAFEGALSLVRTVHHVVSNGKVVRHMCGELDMGKL